MTGDAKTTDELRDLAREMAYEVLNEQFDTKIAPAIDKAIEKAITKAIEGRRLLTVAGVESVINQKIQPLQQSIDTLESVGTQFTAMAEEFRLKTAALQGAIDTINRLPGSITALDGRIRKNEIEMVKVVDTATDALVGAGRLRLDVFGGGDTPKNMTLTGMIEKAQAYELKRHNELMERLDRLAAHLEDVDARVAMAEAFIVRRKAIEMRIKNMALDSASYVRDFIGENKIKLALIGSITAFTLAVPDETINEVVNNIVNFVLGAA